MTNAEDLLFTVFASLAGLYDRIRFIAVKIGLGPDYCYEVLQMAEMVNNRFGIGCYGN